MTILTTSPLILPPATISEGRRHGCPLCAHLERGDVLVQIDSTHLKPFVPQWISPTHGAVYPTTINWPSGFYRFELLHGHMYAERIVIDDISTPLVMGSWGTKKPLSRFLIIDDDKQPWWSKDEHEKVSELPPRLDDLLNLLRPQIYAHHRQLAPIYWSMVVNRFKEYRRRNRVLSNNDEMVAFYGITLLGGTNGLELFAKWELLAHDFDQRWAKDVPLKYQLIRSNLVANPELPHSWPISAKIITNPPMKIYELGGGNGKYLEVITERIDGKTVYDLIAELPAERLYQIGIESLALLHELHYGDLVHNWMHLDPHVGNFMLGSQNVNRTVKLPTSTLELTESLWLIDFNSAFFPEFPTEFVAADFAYANEHEGWMNKYATINPAWDAIYFLRHYWWQIAEQRPELLRRSEFQQFLFKSLEAIPEQLLLFAGQLNPLGRSTEIQQWFYSLLGMSLQEVQSATVEKAKGLMMNGSKMVEWIKAWFGYYRGTSYIGQRKLSIGNGTIGELIESILE